MHAKKGHRHLYKPLRTQLCNDSEPLSVVKRLLSLYPFKAIYMADLDALMANGNNRTIIERILTTFPKIKFWIDQGLPRNDSTLVIEKNHIMVIGSESLNKQYLSTLEKFGKNYSLSLDFNAAGLMGPAQLLTDSDKWPDKVIVMSIDRVGCESGPDYRLLDTILDQYPNKTLVAAGGVRDEADLRQLKERGIAAVLLASALHTGVIDSSVLYQYA